MIPQRGCIAFFACNEPEVTAAWAAMTGFALFLREEETVRKERNVWR